MASLPVHCVNTQGANTQFGTSQSSVPFVGYSPFTHSEYSHSNVSGYGVTGMNSATHLPNWSDNVNIPSADHRNLASPATGSGTPPSGVSYYSPHNQIAQEDPVNHQIRASPSLHGTPVTPHAPTPPLADNSPLPPPLDPVTHVSPHGGASYQQTSQPQHVQPSFPSGSHVHGSSPFSVDFILRETPNNVMEADSGASSSGSATMGVVRQGEGGYVAGSTATIPVGVSEEMNLTNQNILGGEFFSFYAYDALAYV